MSEYVDFGGDPITLVALCRKEPEWAANMIGRLNEHGAAFRHQLEALVKRWRALGVSLDSDSVALAWACDVRRECADELEQVLKEVGGENGVS